MEKNAEVFFFCYDAQRPAPFFIKSPGPFWAMFTFLVLLCLCAAAVLFVVTDFRFGFKHEWFSEQSDWYKGAWTLVAVTYG